MGLSRRDETGAVVRPLPRCKRMICETNALPHVVQLLLTFDPILVEKVAHLLSIVMQVRQPFHQGLVDQYFVLGSGCRQIIDRAGQPCSAAPVPHWCLLLHHDVHGLQHSSDRQVQPPPLHSSWRAIARMS